MPPPTIAGTLKVQAPTFIRKLGRAGHWGQPDDPVEERIAAVVAHVFRNQEELEISVYLVNTDDDLRRGAIGYNAGRRGSLHQTIAFRPILPTELQQCGIQITKTAANLKCDYANGLHYDLIATDAQLEDLCRALIKAGRKAGRCSEGMMKAAAQMAAAENCKSVPNVVQCGVVGCDPSGGAHAGGT